jgi:DNA polymerase (family 10)
MTSKVDARAVAGLLREHAQRISLRGDNPYRSKAYSRAADDLAAIAVPLDVLIEENRLTEIPGVGDAIADIITKLHHTGLIQVWKNCARKSQRTFLMLAVPGLRPDKVLRIYRDLGVTSLAELEACQG